MDKSGMWDVRVGDYRELIAEAFRQVQAESLPEIGAIVGSWQDELAYRLVDIVGEVAICDLPCTCSRSIREGCLTECSEPDDDSSQS